MDKSIERMHEVQKRVESGATQNKTDETNYVVERGDGLWDG